MRNQQAYQAVQETLIAIVEQIGPRYQTCYLYGSLAQGFYQPQQSDINLLMVVDDDTNIFKLRDAFQPVWERHQKTLSHAPRIATHSAFKRHMRLHPVFTRHLSRYGKQVRGSLPTLRRTASLQNQEIAAHKSYRALQASAVLTTSLDLESDEYQRPLRLLHTLVRQLRRGPVDPDESPTHLLKELYTQMPMATAPLKPPPDPPYDIPNLIATYDVVGDLVLVLSKTDQIPHIDWDAISREATKSGYAHVCVTTAPQLQLVLPYHLAAAYTLRGVRLLWGHNFLDQIKVSRRRVLRDIARTGSRLLISDFPHALLTLPDDSEHNSEIIHDFQNLLLNIRLQKELLTRLEMNPPADPPEGLPGRDRPTGERLQGIYTHLEWWTEQFAAEISPIHTAGR